jgi:hypothetical protein
MTNEMTPPKAVGSPDGSHAAEFLYAGEIRFGPPFYTVELDGRLLSKRLFRKRYFGASCSWSSDSRYFALSEWLSRSESRGPETQVVVIDIPNRQECAVDRVRGGFAEPARFEGNTLIYTETFYSHEQKAHSDTCRVDLTTWREWHGASLLARVVVGPPYAKNAKAKPPKIR